MHQHPHDLLPGFALDALDDAEMAAVAAHVRTCATCRDEVERFRATIGMLPYASQPHEPPAHVKQQLFARIAARSDAPRQPHAGGVSATRRPSSWVGVLAAAALILVIALGGMTWNLQRQLDAVLAQQQAVAASLPPAEAAQIAELLSSDRTVSQPLEAERPGIQARMFMQPGHHNAVLMINGLPPAGEDRTYQFWFASGAQQVPARTFTTSQNGVAELLLVAPAAVDTYSEVMVTIEPAGGSSTPSDDIVLAARL